MMTNKKRFDVVLPEPKDGRKTVMVGELPDHADTVLDPSVEKADSSEGAAVMSALVANIIVTASKFICGLFGVQSMMSEAVHSLADSVNEIVLILGKRVSHRPPTKLHPLGGSRTRYFSGFIVAMLLFGVGGLFTFSEAVKKVGAITSGGPNAHNIDQRALIASIIVALLSMAAESWSLHNSKREAVDIYGKTENGEFSLLKFWMTTKSSDLTSVIAEDVLAICGLVMAVLGCGMSLWTRDEIWDSLASLMIGAILIAGAIALGRQNGSLLLGEGASQSTDDKIMSIIDNDDNIIAVLRPLITLHLSERRIEAKIKVQVRDSVDIVDAINHLEDEIRDTFKNVYSVDLWIEPDRYDPELAGKTPQYVD